MLKKIAMIAGLAALTSQGYAQGAKFGLHASPAVSFMGSNDPQVKSNGANAGLGIGMELEYYFMESEKVALTLGVDFSLGKGGNMLYKYGGQFFPNAAAAAAFDLSLFETHPNFLSLNPNQNMVDSVGLDFAGFSSIRQSINYVEIPIALKLRPAEFGDWKIFVHVPEIRAMIPVSATARIYQPDSEADGFVDDYLGYRVTEEKGTKAATYKDINPFQLAVGLGLGAEWAPSDKTRVFAGIYYSASLLDINKKIETRNAAGNLVDAAAVSADLAANGYRVRNPRMAPHTLALRVGVLFVP